MDYALELSLFAQSYPHLNPRKLSEPQFWGYLQNRDALIERQAIYIVGKLAEALSPKNPH